MAKEEMGLKVDLPDINDSGWGWRVKDDETIISSLNFIKGVGDKAAEVIESFQPFNSIEDFFSTRMKWALVNKKVVSALIKTGAFDKLYPHRKTLLEGYLKWNTTKSTSDDVEVRKAHFLKKLKEAEEEFGKETFGLVERLTIEKELFGFYFSGNPLDQYDPIKDRYKLKKVGQLTRGKKWKKGTIYGIVTKAYAHKTRKGSTMCFLEIEDDQGKSASITIWPELYKKYKDVLQENNKIAIKVKPSEDNRGDKCFMVDEHGSKKKIMLLDDLLNRYNKIKKLRDVN